MLCDLSLCDLGGHGVHTAIGIAKYRDLTYAQLAGSGPQFRFARLANDVGTGPLVAIAEPAPLAARGGQQIGLDTFRRVFPSDSSSGWARTHMSLRVTA
jgi:hypothetical protein